MHNGIYIYGIIKTDCPQEFGAIGIGDPASQVLTTGLKDISAVISNSPCTIYDSLAKENTVKDLVTHQFVIETVMRSFTILPVKFGTMVETEAEVVEFLEKGYTLLSDELREMEGKIELNVVATWDLPKVLATLPRRHPRILAQQEEMARKGTRVSVEEKMTLGKSVEQALKIQTASYHQLILQTLQEKALAGCTHDVAHDEMILNAAFLLEKKDEELFQDAVTALDQKLEGTVNFRLVGPLPIYSFGTILLQKVAPHSFEEAKQILGLNGEMTGKTVRDAYHRLAQKYHPDKSNGADALHFHRITSAYKTLQKSIEHGLTHVEVYRWEQDLP